MPIGGAPTRSCVCHSSTCGREEVLARLLVAAAADDPELVAVLHDGRAAQEVEQVVPELDRAAGAAPRPTPRRLRADLLRRAAHVVVAEEGRRRVRDAGGARK